jgi:hypothetical protein
MKKIRIHPEMKTQISKEFKVTMQTVSMSLKYFFDSDKAKAIRKRALGLLQQEINNNKEE